MEVVIDLDTIVSEAMRAASNDAIRRPAEHVSGVDYVVRDVTAALAEKGITVIAQSKAVAADEEPELPTATEVAEHKADSAERAHEITERIIDEASTPAIVKPDTDDGDEQRNAERAAFNRAAQA